jgi:hypothetical protein
VSHEPAGDHRPVARHRRSADDERVIRNVVLHLLNEQPLLADLFEMPQPSDGQLVCTNLRTMNGKRPVFIDAIEATFVFPLGQLRFVEIPPGADGAAAPVPTVERETAEAPVVATPPAPAGPDFDLDLDEDFLRRVREL